MNHVGIGLGDVLVAVTILVGLFGNAFWFGRKIGSIESWIHEASGRFDRLEHLIERRLNARDS